MAALHAHDRLTRGHSERVRALTVMVGREMNLEPAELDRLEWAGLLHDIGKLRVPSEILNKPGAPDQDEWSVLRRHPGDGGVIMAPLADWLGEWVHGVDGHHEYHDGNGYPLGLAGDEIALSGRIVAVTDALETMTAVRSYKKPMPVAEARAELIACSGRQFDPEVVRATLAVSLPRLFFVLGPVAAILQVPLAAPIARTAVEVQGLAAATVAAAPRALATVALVLGAVGGGPAANVAGAESDDPVVVELVTGQPARAATEDERAGGSAGSSSGATAAADDGVADEPDGTTSGSPLGSAADDDDGSSGAARTTPSGEPRDPDGPTPAPRTTPPTTTVRPPTTAPPPTVTPPPLPPPPPTTAPPRPDPPGLPAAALACFNGGWVALGFPNQGQCISSALGN